uniref:PH01B031C15.2 protein n=1 Tax=Phyllostachys edulis TaxID=38705 RepID=L0P1S3_PHYED|nr:PH01B031C15.2 [Phyllostachys edulis]
MTFYRGVRRLAGFPLIHVEFGTQAKQSIIQLILPRWTKFSAKVLIAHPPSLDKQSISTQLHKKSITWSRRREGGGAAAGGAREDELNYTSKASPGRAGGAREDRRRSYSRQREGGTEEELQPAAQGRRSCSRRLLSQILNHSITPLARKAARPRAVVAATVEVPGAPMLMRGYADDVTSRGRGSMKLQWTTVMLSSKTFYSSLVAFNFSKRDGAAPEAMVSGSDTKCCGRWLGMDPRTESRTLALI